MQLPLTGSHGCYTNYSAVWWYLRLKGRRECRQTLLLEVCRRYIVEYCSVRLLREIKFRFLIYLIFSRKEFFADTHNSANNLIQRWEIKISLTQLASNRALTCRAYYSLGIRITAPGFTKSLLACLRSALQYSCSLSPVRVLDGD